MPGQSLELFFVDGKPDGLLTAQIFNWTGHVLMIPRIQLSEAFKRIETGYTGAYILLGEDAESSLTRAYIGEADDVAVRIKNHDSNKDWWTTLEFVVLQGSKGRGHWIGVEHNYQKLFDEVVESGAYVGDEHKREFIKAYAFSSPSAAGAVLNGRATAGPIAWTVSGSNKTYKEWEAEQL